MTAEGHTLFDSHNSTNAVLMNLDSGQKYKPCDKSQYISWSILSKKSTNYKTTTDTQSTYIRRKAIIMTLAFGGCKLKVQWKVLLTKIFSKNSITCFNWYIVNGFRKQTFKFVWNIFEGSSNILTCIESGQGYICVYIDNEYA